MSENPEIIGEVEYKGKKIDVYRDHFVKLQEVSTNAATPSNIAFENMKKNVLFGLPKIEKLPEYQKVKGHSNPIALVGGGPSLKTQIEELRKFRTILACGSVHDYLINQGIVPTYAAICDPDPISVNYFKNLHAETKYLISSSVDEKLLKHFNGYPTVLWHCHSTDFDIEEMEKIEGISYHGISGGCTIGLRAINIAIMMGYTNIHFFGYDSCMSEEECHAYEISEQERINFGILYKMKLRKLDGQGPADKLYICHGYQLAQVDSFRSFFLNFGRLFSPTFHGEGLLPDYWKLMISVLGVEKAA